MDWALFVLGMLLGALSMIFLLIVSLLCLIWKTQDNDEEAI